MSTSCAKCGLPLGQEVSPLRDGGPAMICDSCTLWVKPAYWQPTSTCRLKRPQLLAEIRRHRELLAAIEAELAPDKLRPLTQEDQHNAIMRIWEMLDAHKLTQTP